jgi:hypothetical protein
MHRIVSIEEILAIIKKVTGKTVYHVDIYFHVDCEEYILRRR